MLLGRTTSSHNNYYNDNMAEVKMRHKPRRQSSDRITQRHSLHAGGGDHIQWLSMPSYHLHQQQQLLLHQQQQQQQPHSGYFFNQLDGFIYVKDGGNGDVLEQQQQDKDSVRRKAESRQRTQLRKTVVNNNNSMFLVAPPPMMMAAAAPYYVADTLLSSVPYADRAEEDALKYKLGSSSIGRGQRDGCHRRRPTVLDRGCQASHGFDIRDYSVVETTADDGGEGGGGREALLRGRHQGSTRQRQHGCCHCECHTANEEPYGSTRRCQSHEVSSVGSNDAARDKIGKIIHAERQGSVKGLKGMLTKSESFALRRRKDDEPPRNPQKDETPRRLMGTGDDDQQERPLDDGGGLIVSGVPGLGVSLLPRPKFASYQSKEESDDGSIISNTSLQPTMHHRVDLPRATYATSAGNNNNGSSKELSSSSSTSAASLSASRLARSIATNRSHLSYGDPSEKTHPTSSNVVVNAAEAPMTGRCLMPWKDSVFKRTLLQRQSFQWDTSQEENVVDKKDERKKMTLNESSFDKKFPHLSAILRSEQGGPHSLPLRLQQSVPRAPIPVPKGDTRNKDELHYKALKKRNAIAKPSSPPPSPPPRPPQREFSRKSLLLHVNEQQSNSSDSSSASHDFSFSQSTTQKGLHFNTSSSQMYKVLNDRDGNYAYTYDCSLSPAFLIRYNEGEGTQHSNDDDDDEENIYEEINEVKKRVDILSSNKQQLNNNNSSSGGSSNSDSGVHVGRVIGSSRFCNDTLDFGPKSVGGGRKRFVGRGSVDSFIASDSYSEEERSKTTTIPVQPLSSDEFNEIIRRHHSKVLEQLRLDPQDETKEIVCSNNNNNSRVGRSPSTSSSSATNSSKTKKFGFVNRRGKSAGSQSVASRPKPRRPVIRCESMDRSRLSEANRDLLPKVADKKNDNVGWQLFKNARKYLSWKNSSKEAGTKSMVEDGGNVKGREKRTNVGTFDFHEGDEVRHHPAQRFQRARLTSQWEDMHSLPE